MLNPQDSCDPLLVLITIRTSRDTRPSLLLHSLKVTAKAPENRPFAPKEKDRLPTINFRGYVGFREGSCFIPFEPRPKHSITLIGTDWLEILILAYYDFYITGLL